MPSSIEEGDAKAGFYFDIKFLIILTYIVFFIFIVLSGFMLSINIDVTVLIFLCLLFFLDLQEFVEVRVPRYGWKCSKSNYKLASVFLAMGVLFVPIADSLLYSGIITKLPTYLGGVFFLLSIGLLVIPIILGMLFTLGFYLDFSRSLGISIWKRNKEIIEAYSKNSFFYPKLFRRKRSNRDLKKNENSA